VNVDVFFCDVPPRLPPEWRENSEHPFTQVSNGLCLVKNASPLKSLQKKGKTKKKASHPGFL